MSIVYTPKDIALDVVGVTLLFLPEPVTTPIAIAILCRKRGGVTGEKPEPARPAYVPPEYVYKIDNIRGRQITWQARTILPGQLPLSGLNKPAVKIKERHQSIYSHMQTAAGAADNTRRNLPPGVKVHHELYKPPKFPAANQPAFIPGETIHHTVKPLPQSQPVNKQPYIHHTIENSPAYIKAQAGGINKNAGPGIIHHTIKDSPAMQSGNPGNIVKPVRIVKHHTLNATPPMRINGRLVRPPLIPPAGKDNNARKNDLPGNKR
ncbi:MAG: hypothetical protein JW901_10080 [Dehalococcoidia bacterium]|nr:hypothetical protein [Dehalococcoidia bacterium]